MANEIERIKVELPDPELVSLADRIVQVIEEGKQALAISINETIKTTYWKIGRYIVEFEQEGKRRAKYGTAMLSNLAKLLRARVGRGYSHPNLNNMRKFYLMYPNFQISDKSTTIFQTSEKSDFKCQTVSDKLTWSHICELVTIDDQLEREFYEKECISQGWTVDELHRQKESGLFMRLAVSKDKQGVLMLAHEGQQIQTPEDVVKSTYTLEFLGIEDKKRYKEKDLENKLIDNMQMFLLELGKGFTFVKRQYGLTINNVHYHIDLVFYHRILRCFVLIDMKRGAVKHKDIGQMNMYLGYFAKEENVEGDNPPIGIIMSHYKDELMVEYATYGMDSNLFVSKYELFLPNKEELRKMVRAILVEK
jgi:predicted nuclease of restriction endonuclease-like (RecB) superfamily